MLFCQANCFNFSLVKTVFLSSILNCEKRKTLKNELNVELMLVVYKLEVLGHFTIFWPEVLKHFKHKNCLILINLS